MDSEDRGTRRSARVRRNSAAESDRNNTKRSRSRERSRSRSRSGDRSGGRATRSRRRASSVESTPEKKDAQKRQREPENESAEVAGAANQEGEISLSVEETNALRARLGLKPLNESSKVKQAEQNYREQKQRELEAKQAEELRANIEKARNKRLLKEKLAGPTLGEATEDEGLQSAADWVRRSRMKEVENKGKQQVSRMEQRFAEQDETWASGVAVEAYTAKDLKGLAVAHGAQDFREGEEIILTLKDTSILQRDEHGKIVDVADDVDELENAQLVELQKAKEREKAKKRLRQPAYAGYDDEEFTSGKKTSILAQYDEEKKRGPALMLDGQEQIAVPKEPEEDQAVAAHKAKLQSLAMVAKQAAEFYTPAEFAKFAKPKKKKQKKLRKHTVDDEIPDEPAFDEQPAPAAESSTDHGSRGQRGTASAAAKLAAEQQEKLAAYNRAKAKATLEAEKARQAAQAVEFVDDLDPDLNQSLARVRRLAQAKRRQQPMEDAGAAVAQQLLEAAQTVRAQESKMEVAEEEELDAEGRRKDGTLVFTSTTEFTTRLQARLQERAREKVEHVVREQETGSLKAKHAREEGAEQAMEFESAEAEMSQDDKEESSADVDEEELFTHDQPLVRKGLAATIALLQSTGELNRKEKLAGRARDARNINPNDVVKEIKLEYRDEFGRLLTPKEAFRMQSYVFHGEGPGKKAQAKRLKQRERELKQQTSRDPLSGSLSVLQKTQEATGKAYLMLQGSGGSSSAAVAADMAQQIAKNKAKEKSNK